MNTKAVHFWNSLVDGDISNWELISIKKYKNKCCCGTNILWNLELQHKTTKDIKIIGRNCGAKLGIKLEWKTKGDYLANAYLMARNNVEKSFIRKKQDMLPKWDQSLKISVKEKQWLETITSKKWKGKTWVVNNDIQ
jgi:hypothetical protein